MLRHPAEWISETGNLILMVNSLNPHLTFVLVTRAFLILLIIVFFSFMAVGIREEIKKIRGRETASIGSAILNVLQGLLWIVIGVGFWILVMWAVCYLIGIPPPWETLNEFAMQFR